MAGKHSQEYPALSLSALVNHEEGQTVCRDDTVTPTNECSLYERRGRAMQVAVACGAVQLVDCLGRSAPHACSLLFLCKHAVDGAGCGSIGDPGFNYDVASMTCMAC